MNQLHLEGPGSAVHAMIESPGDLVELMIASGMVEDAGPFHEAEMEADRQYRNFLAMGDAWGRERRNATGQWVTDRVVQITDCCMEPEIVGELEWAECCEPSFFKVYDQTDTSHCKWGGARMVVNNRGEAVAHDAQRHEQECALNELANISLPYPNDLGEFFVGRVECKLVASGDKFSVATTEYGAVFVPRSCANYLPGLGGTFRACLNTTFEKMRTGTGKYPLRVQAGSICY
jgi:hypothetical protein